MKAFVNTPITKEQFVKELKWHQEQDAFVAGRYHAGGLDKNFKGCAVGCSLHSIKRILGLQEMDYSAHKLYAKYLNVPTWIACLEDRLFEGMPIQRRKTWPVEFGEAINVGAELDKIKVPFLIFVFQQASKQLDREKFPEVKSAIDAVIRLYEAGETDINKFKEVERAAGAARTAEAAEAAGAAEWAARAAAWAARAAAEAAWAARAAAEAAGAARTAAETARAARAAAEAIGVARAAAEAARAQTYEQMADKLLELMRECKEEGE